VFAQRREQKRPVILNPEFTSRVREFDHPCLTFSIPICWFQVFFVKPDLITTPPRSLHSGTVSVDVKE